MFKYIDLVQDSKEWHDFRRGKIGASDASSIMGVGFHTPYQLYMKKMLDEPVDVNEAMMRGKRLEPVARQQVEQKTGLLFTPKVVQSIERPYMIASMDGVALMDDGTLIALEIKCPGKKAHETAMEGNIPEYNYPQLQHQMYVMDLGSILYYSFDGLNGIIIEVKRNEHYIVNNLLPEIDSFWKLICDGKTPPLTVKDRLSRQDYAMQQAAKVFDVANADYLVAKAALDEAEKQRNKAKEELIKLAEGHSIDGFGVRVTRSVVKGLVDYKAIPELKGVDLDRYRKPAYEKWIITSEGLNG